MLVNEPGTIKHSLIMKEEYLFAVHKEFLLLADYAPHVRFLYLPELAQLVLFLEGWGRGLLWGLLWVLDQL